MEPVRYPTTASGVTQTERVKRGKPRGDSGRGSAFARYLRQKKKNATESPPSPAEELDETADATPVEAPSEGGSQTPKKLIDIRV